MGDGNGKFETVVDPAGRGNVVISGVAAPCVFDASGVGTDKILSGAVAVGTNKGNSGLNTGVIDGSGASCLSATENLIVARTGSAGSGISP